MMKLPVILVWSLGVIMTSALLPTVHAQIAWKHFRGMCDASALEMLTDDLFVTGNDEDNVLRVYSRSREGFPARQLDFSSFYRLPKNKDEIDLEGSARLGDRIYWISSHGAKASGKPQFSRHRLFATQVFTNQDGAVQLRPAGQLYTGLVRDLAGFPPLARYNFRAAAAKAPKTPGALNIEGLAPGPDGSLLIGFRNPVPDNKALVVPLLNPASVTAGQRAAFGPPLLLDLQGLGIRSLTPYREGCLVVAGSFTGSGPSRLFYWSGHSDTAPQPLTVSLPGNPEGIAVISRGGQDLLFAISDDGAVRIGSRDCKKLKDPALKVFRGYQMPLPALLEPPL